MAKKTVKDVKIPSVEKHKVIMKKGKTFNGKVISDKMQMTAVVEIVKFFSHPMYGKRMRKTIKFHAHNKLGAKIGDQVVISEIRPMSKTVSWEVIQINK